MKWLKRKLYKWVTEGDKYENQIGRDCGINEAKVRPAPAAEEYELTPNLRMNIINAIGGKIVRFIGDHDHQKDRRNEKLYIITDEEDFNESLSKIITMESMRS